MDSNANTSTESMEAKRLKVFDQFIEYILMECRREFAEGETERRGIPFEVFVEGEKRFAISEINIESSSPSVFLVELQFELKEVDYQTENSHLWDCWRMVDYPFTNSSQGLACIYPRCEGEEIPTGIRDTRHWGDDSGRLRGTDEGGGDGCESRPQSVTIGGIEFFVAGEVH